MEKYYVPFDGELPTSFDINGHRIVLLFSSPEQISGDLSAFGANEVRELDISINDATQLGHLAEMVDGGIVVAPPDIEIDVVLKSLEAELPWLH